MNTAEHTLFIAIISALYYLMVEGKKWLWVGRMIA